MPSTPASGWQKRLLDKSEFIKMIKDILIVGIGSCFGGVARYLISLLMRTASNGSPWGTFTVNIAGCLLIGLLWGWTLRNPNIPSAVNLLIGVGFCGGFTTFSTFSKESVAMLQTGAFLTFLLYAISSILLGVACVAIGYAITK
jgi:CrcB protein